MVMFQVGVFCVVMPCSTVVGYQCSRGPWCLHLHPGPIFSMDLWNGGILPQRTTRHHNPEDLDLLHWIFV